jgi:Spy/CpxP family protein refolding chaperone
MRHNAIVVVACGLALAVFGASVATAQTTGQPPAARQNRAVAARAAQRPLAFVQAELRGLQLTDAQKGQVKAILQQHQAEIQKLRQDIQVARQQKDKDAAKAAMADEQALRQTVQAEILNILTPEQQQRVQKRNQALRRRLAARRPPAIRK